MSLTNKTNFKSYENVRIKGLYGHYTDEVCLKENNCKFEKTCIPDYTVAEKTTSPIYCEWDGNWQFVNYNGNQCPVCKSGGSVSCLYSMKQKTCFKVLLTLFLITYSGNETKNLHTKPNLLRLFRCSEPS